MVVVAHNHHFWRLNKHTYKNDKLYFNSYKLNKNELIKNKSIVHDEFNAIPTCAKNIKFLSNIRPIFPKYTAGKNYEHCEYLEVPKVLNTTLQIIQQEYEAEKDKNLKLAKKNKQLNKQIFKLKRKNAQQTKKYRISMADIKSKHNVCFTTNKSLLTPQFNHNLHHNKFRFYSIQP